MSDPKATLINFLVAARRLPPLSELTGDEERMLFELYALAERKARIFVTDVYALDARKSASACYRTLLGLRDKGLVDFDADDRDKRKKSVIFTPRAAKVLQAFA